LIPIPGRALARFNIIEENELACRHNPRLGKKGKLIHYPALKGGAIDTYIGKGFSPV
jgi:hypothetical protein